jgi:hypothetical protein
LEPSEIVGTAYARLGLSPPAQHSGWRAHTEARAAGF